MSGKDKINIAQTLHAELQSTKQEQKLDYSKELQRIDAVKKLGRSTVTRCDFILHNWKKTKQIGKLVDSDGCMTFCAKVLVWRNSYLNSSRVQAKGQIGNSQVCTSLMQQRVHARDFKCHRKTQKCLVMTDIAALPLIDFSPTDIYDVTISLLLRAAFLLLIRQDLYCLPFPFLHSFSRSFFDYVRSFVSAGQNKTKMHQIFSKPSRICRYCQEKGLETISK